MTPEEMQQVIDSLYRASCEARNIAQAQLDVADKQHRLVSRLHDVAHGQQTLRVVG